MQYTYLVKLFLCLFCLLNQVVVIHAAELDQVNADAKEGDIVQSSLQRSAELQLSQHESWLALLHYKRETLSRRFLSQADDEKFFLDRNGKTDAHAELVADIKAFLRGPESNHAQCRFPARWWWLKRELNMPSNYDVRCPQLEVFMLKMSHDKLYLVFPTMYLNNPGSIFGHTFLRFDEDEGPVLLSQTLNYAARADKEDNLVSYVNKGLFGGYQGIFKARRYFETVQEYSDIENRDIWEYELAFSPEEIAQLVRHVWEVKDIDFDYYFFRENCAYRLLALIDVIRPQLQLTGEGDFSLYAIPVDTVRALEEKQLILTRKFRASLVTKIDDSFLDNEDSTLVMSIVSAQTADDKELITSMLQVLPTQLQQLKMLEQSYNILQFYGESASPKAKIVLRLINELSMQISTESVDIPPKTISPEKGHDSIRLAAGYGEQNNHQYMDLKFRPAFHDLLDSPQGYIDGAAINVFDTRLKWFEGKTLKLESLSLINVTSLSPLSAWRKPVSWLFDFRLDRHQLSETRTVRNFISRGGVGVSIKRQSFIPFALLTGDWDLSSGYSKGYSLLLGVQLGLHFNYKANQFMLSYEKDAAVSGFDLDRNVTQLQWQYDFKVNHAMRLFYKRTDYDLYSDKDWTLGYHYYF